MNNNTPLATNLAATLTLKKLLMQDTPKTPPSGVNTEAQKINAARAKALLANINTILASKIPIKE